MQKLIGAILLSAILAISISGCKKETNDQNQTAVSNIQYNHILSRVGAPDKNPLKILSKMIGVQLISVQYFSPFYSEEMNKNRELWGTEIKNDVVWKIGALPGAAQTNKEDRQVATLDVPCKFTLHKSDYLTNELQKLSSQDSGSFRLHPSEELQAGTYGLYLKPHITDGKESITLYFDLVSAIDNFSSDHKIRELNVPLKKIEGPFQDELWIQINNVRPYRTAKNLNSAIDYAKCRIDIVWGDRSASFLIDFGAENYYKIAKGIEKILLQNDSTLNKKNDSTLMKNQWNLYFDAADYCVHSANPDSIVTNYGLKWITKAQELFKEESDPNTINIISQIASTKALILARARKYEAAISEIDFALNKLAKEDQKNQTVRDNIDFLELTEKNIKQTRDRDPRIKKIK